MGDLNTSVECEEGLLGAILLDYNRVMPLCQEARLDQDAFTSPERQLIFRAVSYLYQNKKAVDVNTLSNILTQYDKLGDVGGPMGINAYIDKCPTAVHAEHYIDIIGKKWVARKAERALLDAVQLIQDTPDDAVSIITNHMQSLSLMSHSLDLSECQAEVWGKVEQEYEMTRSGILSGLPTPWPVFNKVTGGFPKEVLSIVAGREGTRKSFLVMQCAVHGAITAENPRRGAYFAFEDGVKTSMRRAACLLAGVNPYLYIHARLTPDELISVNAKGRMLADSNLSFIGGRGRNIDDLCAEIERGIRRKGWEFIFLDAFKDVYGEDKYKSSRLFDVAQNHEIPVVVVHHVKKAVADDEGYGDKDDQFLSYRNIKGFTEITADARFIGMLQCRARRAKEGEIVNGETKHRGELVLEDFVFDLQKNNHGKTGKVDLVLDEQTGRFDEYTPKERYT